MILVANLYQKFQSKTYATFFFYVLCKLFKNNNTKLDEKPCKYEDTNRYV